MPINIYRTTILFSLLALWSIETFAGTHQVLRVVDGDTIIIDDGRRIQLLGVDAPEINDRLSWNERQADRMKIDVQKIDDVAEKAKAFIESLVKNNEIEVELDSINYNTRSKDAYGRTLAYVYISPPKESLTDLTLTLKELQSSVVYDATKTKIFLNASLIRMGYAFAYSRYPVSLMDDLLSFQSEARDQRVGFWN